jgi:hypothetical protein
MHTKGGSPCEYPDIKEYLTLGGVKELVEREALAKAGQKLPDPFYWYLWGNLEHLRSSYCEHTAHSALEGTLQGT